MNFYMHWKTKARAAKAGVELELQDDGTTLATTSAGLVFTHQDPKQALEMAIAGLPEAGASEPEAEALDQQQGEEEAEALDQGDDDDEEATGTGSIIKPKYKAAYKERGNEAHCGDWLAVTLDGMFKREVPRTGTKNGMPTSLKPGVEFDTDAFTELLKYNGIELAGPWWVEAQTGNPGWKGRFRMNGRRKLERLIAINGVLHTRNGDTTPPADWLADMKRKHKQTRNVLSDH